MLGLPKPHVEGFIFGQLTLFLKGQFESLSLRPAF